MTTAGTNAVRDAGTPRTAGNSPYPGVDIVLRLSCPRENRQNGPTAQGVCPPPSDAPVVIDGDDAARWWENVGEGWQAVLLGLLLVLSVRLGLTVPW